MKFTSMYFLVQGSKYIATTQCLNNSILLTSSHKKINRCEFHDVAGNRGGISFELYNDSGFTELF